jgi:hypothetical protein
MYILLSTTLTAMTAMVKSAKWTKLGGSGLSMEMYQCMEYVSIYVDP